MKLLIILVLVLVLCGLIYWLIRPYIQMARKALGFLREIRTGTFATGTPQFGHREKVGVPQKLVQCARCATWVPHQRALAGRGESQFCSPACQNQRAGS